MSVTDVGAAIVDPTYGSLAGWLAGAGSAEFRARSDLRRTAERTLFNVVAVALGARHNASVGRLAGTLPATGGGQPAAPGLALRVAPPDAALLTGFAAHLDDYDDTHLETVIHPGAACLGAIWASGGGLGMDAAVEAFALGCELQLRLGLAVTPHHYDRGWHITGTCGVLGAAATAALATALPAPRLENALRYASVRTLGLREAFGTDLKAFHAGKAAANGVEAARRAAVDTEPACRNTADALPTLRPLLDALSPAGADPRHLDPDAGPWALLDNTFKPYPCGIVAHPGIDAAIRLHHDLAGGPDDVASVTYRCNPLVPELMGRASPRSGLEARFSAVHGVAVGIIKGRAGVAEFSDDVAVAAPVAALRARITLAPSADIARDQAQLEVRTHDGPRVVFTVDAARGSARRPLTDDDLVDKAAGLVGARAAATLWERLVDGDRGATGIGTLRAAVHVVALELEQP